MKLKYSTNMCSYAHTSKIVKNVPEALQHSLRLSTIDKFLCMSYFDFSCGMNSDQNKEKLKMAVFARLRSIFFSLVFFNFSCFGIWEKLIHLIL